MTLLERIQQEIKAAMMARDACRLGALRLLKSALTYAQIEKKSEILPDADVIAIIQKEIKKRRDAAEQFQAAGRAELAANENAEIAVLEPFLPQPISPAELETLARRIIQELGATSRKEMGAVIKAVQTAVAGRADGKTISGVVGRLLG